MTEMHAQLQAEIVTTTRGFYALAAEWSDLLENSPTDNPFLSHQWLGTWWEIYGSGELLIIAVRAADRTLVGLLPLHRAKVFDPFPVVMVRFMGSSQVSSDFLECIVRRGWEESVYHVCLNVLQQKNIRWDVLMLQDMHQDSSFCRYLTVANSKGMKILQDPGKSCPYLMLPDSWEQMLDRLSKKVRQRVGYHRRALARMGNVELEPLTNSADLQQGLADMVRLRQDRMNQKGLPASKVNEKYIQFHNLLMPRFQVDNRLQLYFLKIDGQRIAYLYLFSGSDNVYFYQTGFDREWSRHSVGFVLLGMVIEKMIENGFKQFEFLRGDEPYKYGWGTVSQKDLVDVIIPSGTFNSYLWQKHKAIINYLKRIADAKGAIFINKAGKEN